jgi:CRISPR-associated exonuclease Cas4
MPKDAMTGTWREEEIVMVSAIEHYSYCPRQCALIHVEQIFQENVFTLRGRRAHERADQAISTVQDGVRIERALPLWSDRYGLSGRADVVEFHPDGRIVPVEYKQGARRGVRRHDDVQLCAQALCLEEMLGTDVTEGTVFYDKTKRRRVVRFTQDLRDETVAIIASVREMQQSRRPLPPATNDARCPNCSLFDACVPATVVAAREARLAKLLYVPLDIA